MFRGASFLLLLNWVCIVAWLISSFESTTATIVVLATNDSYVDRTAAFGPRIPGEGIILTLIPVETLDPSQETTGCRPVPVSGLPINGSWAALVERGGDCSFVEKVRYMQASGAKAVVVGDNQRSGLITMYAREDTSDVLIPSVFIAQHHYRELRYFGNEFGDELLIKMTPDDMNWPLLDVIIFIILSPAFVVFFLYFLWRIRIRQQNIADLAPPEVVTNLPIKVFYAAKLKENDPVECVICLEEFEDEAELRVLPCRHEYHVACIDNWLITRKKFCPICKRDICTATETTPLLRSPSGANRNNSNNHTRGGSYGVTPRTNVPATYSSSSSSSPASSSSSSSSSSSAPSSSTSGPRIPSSWPLSHQVQSSRAAVHGSSARAGRGGAIITPSAGRGSVAAPASSESSTSLATLAHEEQVLRRV